MPNRPVGDLGVDLLARLDLDPGWLMCAALTGIFQQHQLQRAGRLAGEVGVAWLTFAGSGIEQFENAIAASRSSTLTARLGRAGQGSHSRKSETYVELSDDANATTF